MDLNQIKRVRQISQQFAYTSLKLHEEVSKTIGFSATDHKYLGFFLQKGSLTAGELAGLTGLTTGAVTGLIDRFEKKKLVKRKFDKSDRRKVIIVPDSERIIALLEPFYKEFQQETENILVSFNEDEIEIIEAYLMKNIELMKITKTKLENGRSKK